MDPQEQITPGLAMKPIKPEVKRYNYVIITILSILAVGGFVFSGIELWQNVQKENKINELSDQLEKSNGQANEDVYSDIDEDENESENGNNDKNGYINIKIIADLDSVELEKCESDSCLSGSGYVIGVADSDLRALPLSNQILFSRYGGVFSGKVFRDGIVKDFEFNGGIKQVIVGKFGNGGDEAILILKKDGTVGAIRLDENDDFISVQAIDGISDVNVLYQGYKDNGGEVFAVYSNGSADALYEKIWRE